MHGKLANDHHLFLPNAVGCTPRPPHVGRAADGTPTAPGIETVDVATHPPVHRLRESGPRAAEADAGAGTRRSRRYVIHPARPPAARGASGGKSPSGLFVST